MSDASINSDATQVGGTGNVMIDVQNIDTVSYTHLTLPTKA